jgi:hypothetical protein
MSTPVNVNPGFIEQTDQSKETIPTPSELEAQQPTHKFDDKSVKVESEHGDSLHEAVASTIVVDWEGENDPANPMNWSKTKRISQVVLVSAITMVTLVLRLKLVSNLDFC